jgi:hypothetical protein
VKDVRFTPESGHWIEGAECPLSAKSGHWEVMTADMARKRKALVFADQRRQLATVSGGTDMPKGDKGTPRGISERSEVPA